MINLHNIPFFRLFCWTLGRAEATQSHLQMTIYRYDEPKIRRILVNITT